MPEQQMEKPTGARRAPKAIAALAVGLWMSVGAPVNASLFGSDWDNPCDATFQSQCVSENRTITYHYYSVGSAMTWASGQMLTYYNNNTDLVISSTTGTGEIRIYDEYYPSLIYWGFTLCAPAPLVVYGGNPLDHTAWCRPQDVVYNTRFTAGWNNVQQRYLACHEIGHTFGLRHYNDEVSCMRDADLTGSIQVTSHEIVSHLNVRY